MDIASQDFALYASAVSIFLGRGNGTFNQSTSYAVSSSNYFFDANNQLRTGDFNGDGISDLAVSVYYALSVNILIGRGNGSFNTAVSYQSDNSQALAVDDFNNDGVQDILGGGYSTSTFDMFTGNSKEGTNPLLPFDLTTMSGARQALPVFDRKIQQLATQRGKIGAFQSRINVGTSVLQATSENYAAAESRIRNVDIADESSRLARLNILQQASASILGQANLQPALALKLLKN